jgi:hypothetical protein
MGKRKIINDMIFDFAMKFNLTGTTFFNECISLWWALATFSSSYACTEWVDFFEWGISPSKGLYLRRRQHERSKRTRKSTTRVGFEPVVPVMEHGLDSSATVTGGPIS